MNDSSDGQSNWTTLPGTGCGYVRTHWQDSFGGLGLRTITDFLQVKGEPLSKPGLKGRYRARLQVSHNSEIRFAYLKRFERENYFQTLKRWWEDRRWYSPAERELHAALSLSGVRIGAPEPLAWGRSEDGRSFVVLSEAPGIPADRWLNAVSRMPSSERWEKELHLTKAIAELARRLHTNGFCHRDFYLCHIFVSEAGKNYHLSLIDLQRVFQPRWRVRRWIIKDLAQLNYSASPAQVSRTMKLRFAKRYLDRKRFTSADKSFFRAIAKKSERIARHDRV